jgi:uncharacterized protein (TIRG00374 family)
MLQNMITCDKNLVNKGYHRGRPSVWKLLNIFVSIALLVWLAHRFGWKESLDALRSVPWFIGSLGFLLMALNQIFAARRLQLLLQVQDIYISYVQSLNLTFLGLFANNFLPGTITGDAAKVLILAQKGHPKGILIESVLVDRLFSVGAMVTLLPTAFVLPRVWEPTILSPSELYLALFFAAGIFIGALYVMRRHAMRRLEMDGSASPLVSRVIKPLNSIFLIALKWMGRPKIFSMALFLSWVAMLSSIVAGWIIARRLGIAVGFIEFLAIAVIVYFVGLLPISFNGLGPIEASFVYLLCKVGAAPQQGLALAIMLRLFLVITSLPGAFGILAWRKWR